MRLLILTQTIDKNDSSLGFFQRWVSELAPYFERVTVFALRVGTYTFPDTVKVYPLREGTKRARLHTTLRVLTLSLRHRKEYDAVFVHMNQEYLLVAGLLWRCMGKKVYMWRNHYTGSLLTDIAALFCHNVFYTSRSSYTAKYKNSLQMPVGVDVGSCHLEEPIARIPRSILFLGRLDVSKGAHILLEALGQLKEKGISFTATFVGGQSDAASLYEEKLKARAAELGIAPSVSFVGAIPNTETYRFYRSHEVYVNCSKSGMLDKSLFKSIACGCVAVFASNDMAELVGNTLQFQEGNAEDLARVLTMVLAQENTQRAALLSIEQKAIAENTLEVLGKALANVITTP